MVVAALLVTGQLLSQELSARLKEIGLYTEIPTGLLWIPAAGGCQPLDRRWKLSVLHHMIVVAHSPCDVKF